MFEGNFDCIYTDIDYLLLLEQLEVHNWELNLAIMGILEQQNLKNTNP